jgi:hypothetical protein
MYITFSLVFELMLRFRNVTKLTLFTMEHIRRKWRCREQEMEKYDEEHFATWNGILGTVSLVTDHGS